MRTRVYTSEVEGQKEKGAGSSAEQGAWCGAPPQDPGIMTQAEVRRLMVWATEVPWKV